MAILKTLKVKYTPQFKNIVIYLALDAAVLTATNPEVATRIFKEILEEMAQVKYFFMK